MQCSIFEEADGHCYARIYATAWKADQTAIQKYCKTENFRECPRYQAYMEYQEKSSGLKLERK